MGKKIIGVTVGTPIKPDLIGGGGNVTVDQTFNPESENAQSGKAVAEAIGDINTALDNIIAIQENLIGGGNV